MTANKATRQSKNKSTLTSKKARVAAKAAKEAYGSRAKNRSAAWKKGGREWSRVLGHFGLSGSPSGR